MIAFGFLMGGVSMAALGITLSGVGNFEPVFIGSGLLSALTLVSGVISEMK